MDEHNKKDEPNRKELRNSGEGEGREKQGNMGRSGKVVEKVVRTDVYETDSNKFPAGPYFKVRKNRNDMMVEELVVGETEQVKRKEAGFDVVGDDRVKRAVMRHRMDINLNMSLSFDPATMLCKGCKERGPHRVDVGIDGGPVVIAVTDQNFPPLLYSQDRGQCIGIVRLEFGTAKELGYVINDLLDEIDLPEGSVILVSSISDLGRQGRVGYAEDLARTIRIARERQSKKKEEDGGCGVQVVAVPPIPIGGINSFRLLRGVLEIEAWMEHLIGGDGGLLHRTRAELFNGLRKEGVGRRRNIEEGMDTFPRAVIGWEKIRIRLVGWVDMPERVKPFMEDTEGLMVEALVSELRTNFGVRNLSENICLDRSKEVEGEKVEYVVWGGSNAGKLAKVMRTLGKEVQKVTEGGWRPTKTKVEGMVKDLTGKVKPGAVVVMMGLDNGVFYQEDEDTGNLTLPATGEDGAHHVHGSLEVAGPKKVKGMMYDCKDVFDLFKENKKVVITPMPRWFRTPCCEDRGHCTNIRMPNYRRGMLQDLTGLKDAVDDYCREEGMRMYKVVSGGELVGFKAEMEEDEAMRLLGQDAVHLAPGGYACMAENLIRMVEQTKNVFAGEKREREDSQSEAQEIGSWGRKRHEWLYCRVSGEGAWRPGRGGRGMGEGRGGMMAVRRDSASGSGSGIGFGGYGMGRGRGGF